MKAMHIYLLGGLGTLLLMQLLDRLLIDADTRRLQQLLSSMNPARERAWYRVLEDWVMPALVAALVLLAWPLVLPYSLAQHLRLFLSQRREQGAESQAPAAFAVRPEHLQRRWTLAEIEEMERVHDPLGAVPDLPFGHLHAVWQRFMAQLDPHQVELWSFEAEWPMGKDKVELRRGYVAVRRGWTGRQRIGPHFLSERIVRIGKP